MADVWVVGSVNEDLVVHAERAPGPGETVLGTGLSRGPGGKGANQAVAATRAGARTRIVAAIGADDAGARQRAALEAAGVLGDRLLVVAGQPTGTALITVDGRGENTIVVVPGANATLDAHGVVAALKGLRPGDVVLAQGEIAPAAIEAAAQAASAAGAAMVLNLAPVVPVDLSRARVDVLVVNEHEAALLDPGDRPVAERAGRLAATGGGTVVVTQGAQGALLADAHGAQHLPAYPPDRVVDTTGAGDAFCGAMAAALADGLAVADAVRWGMAAGSLAVRAVGAQGADTGRAAIRRVLGDDAAIR